MQKAKKMLVDESFSEKEKIILKIDTFFIESYSKQIENGDQFYVLNFDGFLTDKKLSIPVLWIIEGLNPEIYSTLIMYNYENEEIETITYLSKIKKELSEEEDKKVQEWLNEFKENSSAVYRH